MAAPVLRAIRTGLVGVGLLVSYVTLAASGRISFAGAVVAPTCHSPGAEEEARARPGEPARRVTCPRTDAVPVSAAQAYILEVLPASATPTGPLLAPLDAITPGREPVQVDQLVTRVYE